MARPAGEILRELEVGKPSLFPDQCCGAGTFVDAEGTNWENSYSETQQQDLLPDYNFNHKERGCFMIFNQKHFDMKNLEIRQGEKDYQNLEEIARILGFKHCKTFHDKKSNEIKGILEKIRTGSHKDYDCFACAILTHGGENDILYAQDKEMTLSDFTSPFEADKCETLAGKPKFFFIQACRGVKPDEGATMKVPKNTVHSDCCTENEDDDFDHVDTMPPYEDTQTEEHMQMVSIPTQADFVIAHASSPDHFAFRNKTFGSWFIDSLYHNVIQHGKTMGILQIMMKVNNRVASFKASGNGSMQIPSFSCTLRSEVYFKEKVQSCPNVQGNAAKATKTWKDTEPEKHMQHVERAHYSSVVADDW